MGCTSFEGDYRDAAGQIGIGSAHGSNVTVQSFRVTAETTAESGEITGPPRMSWDGGYIYVKDEEHERAIDWYTKHFGLELKWPTWNGKQDPASEAEKMSSLAFPQRGLIHLKSSRSAEPLAHFHIDWETGNRINF